MNTAQSQIKVTIPVLMKEFLESKANRFGMPLAGYIKHLILKDIENMDYPTFLASEETERAYKKALQEDDSGKVQKITKIDTFFEEL